MNIVTSTALGIWSSVSVYAAQAYAYVASFFAALPGLFTGFGSALAAYAGKIVAALAMAPWANILAGLFVAFTVSYTIYQLATNAEPEIIAQTAGGSRKNIATEPKEKVASKEEVAAKEEAAATVIQSVFRGYLARKEGAGLRLEKALSNLKEGIQNVLRVKAVVEAGPGLKGLESSLVSAELVSPINNDATALTATEEPIAASSKKQTAPSWAQVAANVSPIKP